MFVPNPFGSRIGFEEHSQFSHIRVRTQGTVRSLVYVWDNGEEVVESVLDLACPGHLLMPYTRLMFASYLLVSRPAQALLVGLGGGAMVHFLQHHDPGLRLDVVEIDPLVVDVAEKYFNVRASETIRIFTRDALEHVRAAPAQYDVAYCDAFLQPSAETDPTGLPLGLKAGCFYDALRTALSPQGLVVMNLNRHDRTDADVRVFGSRFAHFYAHYCEGDNIVVFGSQHTPMDRAFRASACRIQEDYEVHLLPRLPKP